MTLVFIFVSTNPFTLFADIEKRLNTALQELVLAKVQLTNLKQKYEKLKNIDEILIEKERVKELLTSQISAYESNIEQLAKMYTDVDPEISKFFESNNFEDQNLSAESIPELYASNGDLTVSFNLSSSLKHLRNDSANNTNSENEQISLETSNEDIYETPDQSAEW
ncbi:unnamed protein product [Thelazia callipaeda]|uniref:HAP1 N-terminal domain-containing protein n=1 Tax=Thelazia callipaeda TaxID=103827 RepID=A0A0N5D1Y7_THECL|nr:unnamed protein product [Thelazia callipaeda]